MSGVVRDHRPLVVRQLQEQRRRLAAQSPRAFAAVYLFRHLSRQPSRLHENLFQLAAAATRERRKRIAIAAPRGHAKSTVISLGYVLWSLIYGHEPFVLLVSATREQAIQLLKTVKDELQTNPLLLQDFPDICYRPGSKPAPKPWRDHQIVLRNQVCVRALGANQGLRGMKHGRHRPSLIIVDDLENQEHVQSAEQRQKLRDWFEKTLLKTGDPNTNVIVVGTILHYDSLLAQLTGTGSSKGYGWESQKYQAVESFSANPRLWADWEAIFRGDEQFEGEAGLTAARNFFEANREQMLEETKVLWPELEDYYQLMQIRLVEGWVSFQSEKQNDPVDPATCIFKADSFRFWDDEHDDVKQLVARIGSHARFFGACDPSLGRRAHTGDYTAIVVLLQDTRDKTLYVIAADMARRRPNETVETILSYASMYPFEEFAVEGNQFQELLVQTLAQQARRRGLSLRLHTITNTGDKKGRIQSLEPLISQGHVRLYRKHNMLIEQLRQFPMADHDDGPDALEMAVQTALRRRYTTRVVRLTGF